MTIDDIPSLKSINFPESVSIKLSLDAFQYLKDLKEREKKDSSALLRMLLDKFILENPLEKSA